MVFVRPKPHKVLDRGRTGHYNNVFSWAVNFDLRTLPSKFERELDTVKANPRVKCINKKSFGPKVIVLADMQ